MRIELVKYECDNLMCDDSTLYYPNLNGWEGNAFHKYDGHYASVCPEDLKAAGEYCDNCVEEIYCLAGNPSQEEFNSHIEEMK